MRGAYHTHGEWKLWPYVSQSVSQSVLHGEGSPFRKRNDPCTSRGLKGTGIKTCTSTHRRWHLRRNSTCSGKQVGRQSLGGIYPDIQCRSTSVPLCL